MDGGLPPRKVAGHGPPYDSGRFVALSSRRIDLNQSTIDDTSPTLRVTRPNNNHAAAKSQADAHPGRCSISNTSFRIRDSLAASDWHSAAPSTRTNQKLVDIFVSEDQFCETERLSPMNATVIQHPSSRPTITPVFQIIRTGESSYKQLETLHAEGRLQPSTVIVDASKATYQRQFLSALKNDGAEIILDTKCAELSELAKYSGFSKGAPWANTKEQGPLQLADFAEGANSNIYAQIARLAREVGADAVLSASHFLREGADDSWFASDLRGVHLLRAALDREGGNDIGIDYCLILRHVHLHDFGRLAEITRHLRNLPFDNLVVRLSGFGADAAPGNIKNTFFALEALKQVGKPILLDHVSGLAGIGALAFGVASGIAYGVGERDRFDARNWHKLPKERNSDHPRGRSIYIPITGLDRSFTKAEIDLIASAQNGRRAISCSDRNCCPHGLESMKENPKAHICYQKHQAFTQIATIPDSRRTSHFMDHHVRTAERKARDLVRVKTADDSINNRFRVSRKRIDSLSRTFENLANSQIASSPLPLVRRVTFANDGTMRSI